MIKLFFMNVRIPFLDIFSNYCRKNEQLADFPRVPFESSRPSHINIAHFCQLIDQPPVGFALNLIEQPDGLRLKTWFGWIGIGNNRVNLDADNARNRVNPSFDFDSLSLQSHAVIH